MLIRFYKEKIRATDVVAVTVFVKNKVSLFHDFSPLEVISSVHIMIDKCGVIVSDSGRSIEKHRL